MQDNSTVTQRLRSLDLLRGLDIFLLTVICPIVRVVNRGWKLPCGFMAQFRHPAWVGFSTHDMIMPLFIFMCGAALPLALPKRLEADGTAGWTYWGHVLRRVGMLWLLGLVVQGEILSFDLHRISFFNNTLQTIACGYLIAAAVALVRARWIRIAIPFALAALYTVFLHTCGDMTPEGNAAVVYETKFLLLFYPDATWHPVKQIADWHYTWWPTIPMFGAMALAGWHATGILRSALSARGKFLALVGVGAGLLALGWALSTFDPVVKHIFTASFTALAMGVSYLLYAAFYAVADLAGWRRGSWILDLFGRHSLLAYCYAVIFLPPTKAFVAVFLSNYERDWTTGVCRGLSKAGYDLVTQLVISTILCLVLWQWDLHCRNRRQR